MEARRGEDRGQNELHNGQLNSSSSLVKPNEANRKAATILAALTFSHSPPLYSAMSASSLSISLDRALLINNVENGVKPNANHNAPADNNPKPAANSTATPVKNSSRPASANSSLATPNPYSHTHANAVNYGSRVRSPSEYKSPPNSTDAQPSNNNNFRPYVFLGGSCDPTRWRHEIAIPLLTKCRIPFFNPQVTDWSPDLIELEAKAKEECEVLLFVVDSQTRVN
jgi:hypothetical protein